MNSHDVHPDPELTPDQTKLVEGLTDTEVKAIDKALLANTCDKWRKVARVVGTTMTELPSRVEGIPDVYYSQRVQKLVQGGNPWAKWERGFLWYKPGKPSQGIQEFIKGIPGGMQGEGNLPNERVFG